MLTYDTFKAGSDARVIRMTRTRSARRETADEALGDVSGSAEREIAATWRDWSGSLPGPEIMGNGPSCCAYRSKKVRRASIRQDRDVSPI